MLESSPKVLIRGGYGESDASTSPVLAASDVTVMSAERAV